MLTQEIICEQTPGPTHCSIPFLLRMAAHQIVRTKMCPQPVHLVVIRTKPQKSRPYRYFLVFTTDLTLSVETIVHYYHLRWKIETEFRDSKESFGFDHYQVRSQTAIQRSVVLSFLSASLTQMMALPKFQQAHPDALPKLKVALKEMNIHWYHPTQWTLGLIARYVRPACACPHADRWQKSRQGFAASFSQNKNNTIFDNAFTDVAG